MSIDIKEIGETLNMVAQQNLDVRTITMGINTMCCADEDIDVMARKVYNRMTTAADRLVSVAEALEREYGIPIVNKRISVTPMAMIAAATKARDLTPLAKAMDSAAEAVGVDFVGGFSAMVQKGIGDADARLMDSIPSALASTSRVCSSLNVASVRAGINMDAVLRAAQVVKDAAQATVDINCYGAAKLVIFSNMVEDSPFMAGAVHGPGEADEVINVGVSGPGVMVSAIRSLPSTADFQTVAETIKATARIFMNLIHWLSTKKTSEKI